MTLNAIENGVKSIVQPIKQLEKSVFECRLDDNDFSRMWERLAKIVKEEAGDWIVAYPIGSFEERNIQTLGVKRVMPRVETYVF